MLLLVAVFLRYLPHAVLDRTGLVCKVAVACQRALPGWANATFSFFMGGILLGLIAVAVYAALSQVHSSSRYVARALEEGVLYGGPLPPGLRGRTYVVDDEVPRSYTMGTLRPRVVISSGLLSGLDEQEVQAVFAHEEGHLIARDNLILLVARTFVATFALLPGVRPAVVRLRRAQELAADDFARRRTGDPLVVASSLQKFARALLPGTTSPGLAFADEGDVVERIRGLVFGQVAVTSRRYLVGDRLGGDRPPVRLHGQRPRFHRRDAPRRGTDPHLPRRHPLGHASPRRRHPLIPRLPSLYYKSS